jgi:guanylate kinase
MNIHRVVTATTREPRYLEQDGVDYHFLSRDEFLRRKAEGWFLETAEFAGALYGTPMAPVRDLPEQGTDVILKIEVQGARRIRELVPDAMLIFVWPPSVDELIARLVGRNTESDAQVEARKAQAMLELKAAREYDAVIVNDYVCRAADALRAIVLADRCRVRR